MATRKMSPPPTKEPKYKELTPGQKEAAERARTAVEVFRRMISGLNAYARAVTGDRKVRIQVSSVPYPYTDGKVIYYRPPIALGDKAPHDRNICDMRDDHGLLLCLACRVREEVLINIYHEIAHIAFGSFLTGKNYMKEASGIGEHLPMLYNSLEDARVDSAMFEARRGTRKMMQADVYNICTTQFTDTEGNPAPLSTQPKNVQINLACYLDAARYDGWWDYVAESVASDVLDEELQTYLRAVREANSVEDIFPLSIKVYNRLVELGYFIEPEQEEQPSEGESDESDESEEEQDQDSTAPSNGTEQPSNEADPEPESDESESDEDGEPEGDAGGSRDQPSEGVEEGSEEEGERTPEGPGSSSQEGEPESPDGSDDPEVREQDEVAGGGEGDDGQPESPAGEAPGEADGPGDGVPEGDPEPGGAEEPAGGEAEDAGDPAEAPLEFGTVEDVEAARGAFHSVHNEEESEEDGKAVSVAVIQGLYFESPSARVTEVEEHRYNPLGQAWDQGPIRARIDRLKGIQRIGIEQAMTELGVTIDPRPSEAMLGPALLKTRRIFSDNQTAAYQTNMRSGRVNAKVLGRRAWKGDDDRLFAKRRLPGKKDYAVQIGMDISGSNLGAELGLLKRAVYAQAELCHRAGIPFSIVAHSASQASSPAEYALHLHYVKEWDEPWTSQVSSRLAELVSVGGNLDGHALEFLRKSLVARPATDKILLYYTDGKMPAANAEEEKVVLVEQVNRCHREGITLLGVGLGVDSPMKYGLDTVVINDEGDLPAVIDHLGKRMGSVAR